VARNNTSGLKHINEYVKEHKGRNTIAMTMPCGCVQNFDKKLIKIIKYQHHVIILDTGLERKHFTTYGLHMNSLEKSKVVHKIPCKQLIMEFDVVFSGYQPH
jgi:hypothetical protein